jgi:hypothetical protein
MFSRRGRLPKGCPVCAKTISADKRRLPVEEVHLKLAARGITLLSTYQTLNHYSQLRCNECGKTWECKIADIFNSREGGCPNCADYGFKPNRPATLYYVQLIGPEGQPLWKIGITNRSARLRLYLDRDRLMSVLLEAKYPLGSQARSTETEILKTHVGRLYRGPKFMRGGGEREIFTCDIFALTPCLAMQYLLASVRLTGHHLQCSFR